jgi:hypothetical protein
MKRAAGYLLGILIALLVILALSGCSSARLCRSLFPESCDPVGQPCEPVVVTEYKKPDPLPKPEKPADTTLEIEAGDWRGFLRALGVDHLEWKAYAFALEHIIDSFNAAAAEAPTNQ